MPMIFYEILVAPEAAQTKRPEDVFASVLEKLSEVAENLPITLEMQGRKLGTRFMVGTLQEYEGLVTNVLFSAFKEAEFNVVDDYAAMLPPERQLASCTFQPRFHDKYPFQTYGAFESDTLAPLLNLISEIDAEDDEIWLQVAIQPLPHRWTLERFGISRWKRLPNVFRGLRNLFHSQKAGPEERAELAEKKRNGTRFYANMTVACVAETEVRAHRRLRMVQDLFRVFRGHANELMPHKAYAGDKAWQQYMLRQPRKMLEFSTAEVATLFHLPDPKATGHTLYVRSRKAEPPVNLPTEGRGKEVCLFGETNYRNKRNRFGFLRLDRRRHLYIIGKSGSGKSKMMELLINSDVQGGHGVCVLDPHGELVDDVLAFVPPSRIQDVVVFDPADGQFPIAFNPLAQTDNTYKAQLTIGLVDIFKKLFSADWNPRLEHLLRHILLALMDSPETTLLSIERMLSNKDYRRQIVENIQDPNIKQFWVNDFASWNEKYTGDAINPLINKIGQLSANPAVRYILGQPDTRFDVRKMMDEQKILLIKLPKGLIGEEITSLLGAMMVTKIYQAAMQRADMDEKDRKDFYFYIDEFQNFSTDTFANILAESRKYRLNMTIAHQYLGQLNDIIKKTVFGNVGSMVIFRTGAEDAAVFAAELAPRFNEHDIMNISTRNFYTKMSIDGEMQDAFSGRTLDMPKGNASNAAAIIQHSRQTYARPLAAVAQMLDNWTKTGSFTKAESKLNVKEFKEPLI
ncbi:MAG: type IV secretory system conjugative DNA transfer family protein [Alphaproteobacteria bacterium]